MNMVAIFLFICSLTAVSALEHQRALDGETGPCLEYFKSEADLRAHFRKGEGSNQKVQFATRTPGDKSTISVIKTVSLGQTHCDVYAYRQSSSGYELFLRYESIGVRSAWVSYPRKRELEVWVETYDIKSIERDGVVAREAVKSERKVCSMVIPPATPAALHE